MDKLELIVELPKPAPPARFDITSPRTTAYNCIAWAAGENQRKWWPDKMGVAYWPKGVAREAACATLGYEVCENGNLEAGFEKVAIFTKPAGTPAHAARQLPTGPWTSKLGNE